MKRQIIAIALGSLSALPAFANEELDYPAQATTTAPAKTVAQVREDLIAANRAGDFVVNAETGEKANSARIAGSKTREQVLAELVVARRAGDIVANAETGEKVNLERALQLSARIGGHLVTGHVDAVGRIREKREEGNGWRIFIDAPESSLRYIIKKGSVAVDGISLTVADVDKAGFSIAIIPHTAKLTTLGFKAGGDSVNLETDIIGKHVERLLSGRVEDGVSL